VSTAIRSNQPSGFEDHMSVADRATLILATDALSATDMHPSKINAWLLLIAVLTVTHLQVDVSAITGPWDPASLIADAVSVLLQQRQQLTCSTQQLLPCWLRMRCLQVTYFQLGTPAISGAWDASYCKHQVCFCLSFLQVTYLQLGAAAITGAWDAPRLTAATTPACDLRRSQTSALLLQFVVLTGDALAA
jgi:hypothetical protein